MSGLSGDPKPSLSLIESAALKGIESEFGDSEADIEISSFEELTGDGSEDSKDQVLSPASEWKKRSTSVFAADILDHRPGWPLVRRASSTGPQAFRARELSVVKWAMSLPNRSPQQNSQRSNRENLSQKGKSDFLEESNRSSSELDELENGLNVLLKTHSSGCKWFSYEILKTATSNFHSGFTMNQSYEIFIYFIFFSSLGESS